MANDLPPIKPRQLLRLLELDGWQIKRDRTREGAFVDKRLADGAYRSTTISTKHNRAIATGTLHHILGPQQTGLGRDGLVALIQKHGLK